SARSTVARVRRSIAFECPWALRVRGAARIRVSMDLVNAPAEHIQVPMDRIRDEPPAFKIVPGWRECAFPSDSRVHGPRHSDVRGALECPWAVFFYPPAATAAATRSSISPASAISTG